MYAGENDQPTIIMKRKSKQITLILALAGSAIAFSSCATEGAATDTGRSTDRAAEAAIPSSHLSDRDMDMISR